MADRGIWMPLYWGDYLGKTSGLSCEEHGAYLLLIAAYWMRGKALPDDDRFLSTVTKLTGKKWKIIRPKIIEYFIKKDGELWHDRVEKELLKSCQRISSAQAKAHARWHPQDMQVTITSTEEERKKPDAPRRSILNGHSESFEAFWKAYPRREAKGAATKAYLKALDKTSPEMLSGCALAYASKMANTEKKFVKMPATWLNQECWTDEGISPESAATPDQIAANIDRADRLLRRGRYADWKQ